MESATLAGLAGVLEHLEQYSPTSIGKRLEQHIQPIGNKEYRWRIVINKL
jgi:hypothetical protein